MRRYTVLLLTAGLVAGCAHPPATAPAGPRTPAFVRYWASPFQRGDLLGAYVSVTVRDGQLEFWHGLRLSDPPGRGDDQSHKVDALAVRRGPALDRLGPDEVVLQMKDLINDVPRLDGQPGLAPQRAFTRTAITYDPAVGYVGLVCSHPAYAGHYLHPALIASPTGRRGDWRYLGQLTGEPAAEAAGRRVWSDGGTILRLADGRWRIYCNGYGPNLSAVVALESDRLEGPWRFRRDAAGQILSLTPRLPSAGGQVVGPFPTVLRVSPQEWHLWTSDRWPPDAIWHFFSTDGLTWDLYGRQPEIIRREDEDWIKCLRAFVAPDGRRLIGLLSVMPKLQAEAGEGLWTTFWSDLPVGPAAVK